MFIKTFISLSVLATHVCAAVVTLYDVSVTDALPTGLPSFSYQVDGTTSIKAINPSQGADVTSYEVHDVRTKEVMFVYDNTATATYTVLSTPKTINYIRVEGKSQLHATATGVISTPTMLPNGGQFAFVDSTRNCQYDADTQQGVCEQEFIDPILNVQTLTVNGTPTTKTEISTITISNTITGPLVPYATVTSD